MSNTAKRLKVRRTWVHLGTESTDVDLDVDAGDGWTARYRLTEQDGVPVVAEVHVFHGDSNEAPAWEGTLDMPSGGLTRTRLRDIPLGPAIVREALKRVQQQPFRDFVTGAFSRKHQRRDAHRRRTRGKEFYADLAARYVEAYRKDPRRPVALLAKELGWKRDQVRDALNDARRAGMLTGAGKGIAGGALTDAALAILKANKGKGKR